MSLAELDAWFFPTLPDNSMIVPYNALIVAGWWNDISGYLGNILTEPTGQVDVYMVDTQTRQKAFQVASRAYVNSSAWFIYNISDSIMLSTQSWEFNIVKSNDTFPGFVSFVRSPQFIIRDTKASSSTSSSAMTNAATSGISTLGTSAVKNTPTLQASASSSANTSSLSSPAKKSDSLSTANVVGISVSTFLGGLITMIICGVFFWCVKTRKADSRAAKREAGRRNNARAAPEATLAAQSTVSQHDLTRKEHSTGRQELDQNLDVHETRSVHELGDRLTVIGIPPQPELRGISWWGPHDGARSQSDVEEARVRNHSSQ